MNNTVVFNEIVEKKVYLVASKKNWIEGESLRQLEKTAELPGIVMAVGLPDIHPGKGVPVGAAFVSEHIIYPHLVGNDVGCGVGLWKTGLKARALKRDKWVKRLRDLEKPWDGDSQEWLLQHGIAATDPHGSLGTIGGGNHFAELQTFHEILDPEPFDALKLDKSLLMLAVHSGSREIGDALFRAHAAEYGAHGLHADSDEAHEYLKQHDYAVRWAAASRSLIAHRVCDQLGTENEELLDLFHNGISQIEPDDQLWLHRKGAVPSDRGPAVIPGTRGSLSYLVMPAGEQRWNAWSLAHGAGRKWNRTTSREQLKSRFKADSLLRTSLGSYVICEDKDLLLEEAPQAYKNVDTVIGDMVEAGLISIVATLKPVITYKVRK